MRPLTAALLVAFAAACAPSEQSPADTAAIPAGAAMDSAGGSVGATMMPGATATPLPAPAESARGAGTPTPARSGARPRTAGTTPVSRGAAADTSTGPRLRPPSKAPGGYIIVPNSAHDSLRMAPAPGTTTGTSTRP